MIASTRRRKHCEDLRRTRRASWTLYLERHSIVTRRSSVPCSSVARRSGAAGRRPASGHDRVDARVSDPSFECTATRNSSSDATKALQNAGPSSEKSRRRPTLPGGLPPSTIGAGGLNCRVRNGNGCFPAAMATGNHALSPEWGFGRQAALSVPKRARASSKPSAD